MSALAGIAFGAMARASAKRATVEPDNRLHEKMVDEMDGPVGEAASAVAPAADKAGEWWVYGTAAIAVAGALLAAPDGSARVSGAEGAEETDRTDSTRRGRQVGAIAVAVVPVLAGILSPAFDRWLPQPPVGPRRRPIDHPVFPSGHAFRLTAVALSAAYVATREGIAQPGRAWPLAGVASATIGITRLVREKHLASDILGGWLAGVSLAAAVAGAYELARKRGREG